MMRKIAAWPMADEITAITLPELPITTDSQPKWIQTLQRGVAERYKTLQVHCREQQGVNLDELRQQCLNKMDKPRTNEIK